MRIQTKRLELRPWKETDEDLLYQFMSDFDIVKNLDIPFPFKREDCKRLIQKSMNNNFNDAIFAIALMPTNEVVGGVELHRGGAGTL